MSPRFTRRLLIGSLITTLVVVVGCTTTSSHQHAPSRVPPVPAQNFAAIEIPTTNLEQLETDPTFLRGAPAEERASMLSRLWFERAQSLRALPGPGYLASLLRSAHLALEVLLSETCRNPFNKVCSNLNDSYSNAVDAIVLTLRQQGWKSPDLAPSQYSFDQRSAAALSDLASWNVEVSTARSRESMGGVRPGLGVAKVGCREVRLASQVRPAAAPSVCSPLTFLLSFEQPPTAEKILARLSVLDGYAREVAEISRQETPIAADMLGAVTALLQSAHAATSHPRLTCLSLPTRLTTTLVAVGEAENLSSSLHAEFLSIALDSFLRERYTPCFYSLPKAPHYSQSARDLLQTIRELITPRGAARLERSPIPLFLISADDHATCSLHEALRRMKRHGQLSQEGRTHDAPFLVHEIFDLFPHQPGSAAKSCLDALQADANELGIPLTPQSASVNAPSADQVTTLRETLYQVIDNTPQVATPSDQPHSPSTQSTEELAVSPVM